MSIPVGLRINFGTKTKILIEGGGYAGLVLGSNRTGTMHISAPDENNHTKKSEVEIDENSRLANVVGLYIGFGNRIPISGFELIVKPGYKFVINSLYSYGDDVMNRYFKVNIGKKNSSSNNCL